MSNKIQNRNIDVKLLYKYNSKFKTSSRKFHCAIKMARFSGRLVRVTSHHAHTCAHDVIKFHAISSATRRMFYSENTCAFNSIASRRKTSARHCQKSSRTKTKETNKKYCRNPGVKHLNSPNNHYFAEKVAAAVTICKLFPRGRTDTSLLLSYCPVSVLHQEIP